MCRKFVMSVWVLLLVQACSPRTEESRGTRDGNGLAGARSPYLREHADNPVNWHEWGPAALEKARKENKPLLISIGYASCHWCHVMEEESFMDPEVAAVMNEKFVAIKVDREERPDIDQIYMNAAQLLNGGGGWPLNAFALPDGRPFFAATYFPKEDWIVLLGQISEAYATNSSELTRQAAFLTKGIATFEQVIRPPQGAAAAHRDLYGELFDPWLEGLDAASGGIEGEQKFPMPANWEFALQHHFLTGDDHALKAVTRTLDRMATGGIYDHLGGGFARYATDREWRVPHFEKMLYDNAQLVSLYAHAWRATGDPLYLRVVRETLAFIDREMSRADGGFYASINADSEGEEGTFYTWTMQEVVDVLGAEAASGFARHYHLSDPGNWEDGKNILYTTPEQDDQASVRGSGNDINRVQLDEAREKLLAARAQRVRPSTDDKVLTSWNALMVTGFIDGFHATGDVSYLDRALKSARLMETRMLPDGALRRDDGGIKGFLDDYAFLARAFVELYQVTFDPHWLDRARTLADYAVAHFTDHGTGMFYYSSDDSEDLVVRISEISDNVMPSSNSAMAEVLFMLGEYYQEEAYAARAREMLDTMAERLKSSVHFHANWARLAGLVAYEPFEVAITGPDAVAYSRELQQKYHPLALYLGAESEDTILPLLENKFVAGSTIIYVCRNRVCKLPVREPGQALDQLKLQGPG